MNNPEAEVISTPEQSNVPEKIKEIVEIIKTIDNEAVAETLILSIKLAMRTVEQMARVELGEKTEIDISDQLDFVSDALGFRLEDLVTHVAKTSFAQDDGMGDKEVDPTTMDFITGDLDDYEKFVAQAKAKESLDFLKQQL